MDRAPRRGRGRERLGSCENCGTAAEHANSTPSEADILARPLTREDFMPITRVVGLADPDLAQDVDARSRTDPTAFDEPAFEPQMPELDEPDRQPWWRHEVDPISLVTGLSLGVLIGSRLLG
jgi:hypothetical protein